MELDSNHMMDELGVTEKYTVDSLVRVSSDCLKSSRSLVEQFEKLEDVDWAILMNDPDKKETAIRLLESFTSLANNLARAELLPLIAFAVVDRSDT